jgi:DNA-directed RNA polymerase subunit RPC12/RpoP
MFITEYVCSHCGEPIIDSFDHCHHCNRPYANTLAQIARAHHAAKLMLVGRCQEAEELERCHGRLLAVSEGLALAEKSGVRISAPFINNAFMEILYEQE